MSSYLLTFDGTEAACDRFAALYNTFLLGVTIAVRSPAPRTVDDVRHEVALLQKLASISAPSEKGTSCGEPMRELVPSCTCGVRLTDAECDVLCRRLATGLVRLWPSHQADALRAFDEIEQMSAMHQSVGAAASCGG